MTHLPDAHAYVPAEGERRTPCTRTTGTGVCGRRRKHGVHKVYTLPAQATHTHGHNGYRTSGTPYMARQAEFRPVALGGSR